MRRMQEVPIVKHTFTRSMDDGAMGSISSVSAGGRLCARLRDDQMRRACRNNGGAVLTISRLYP